MDMRQGPLFYMSVTMGHTDARHEIQFWKKKADQLNQGLCNGLGLFYWSVR